MKKQGWELRSVLVFRPGFLRLRAASDLRLRFTKVFLRIHVCVFLEKLPTLVTARWNDEEHRQKFILTYYCFWHIFTPFKPKILIIYIIPQRCCQDLWNFSSLPTLHAISFSDFFILPILWYNGNIENPERRYHVRNLLWYYGEGRTSWDLLLLLWQYAWF